MTAVNPAMQTPRYRVRQGLGAARIHPHKRARMWTAVLPFSVVLIVVQSITASAEQWRLEPIANVSLLHDDNIDLDAIDPRSSFGTSVALALRGLRSVDNKSIALLAGLDQRWYFDAADLDNTAGFVGLEGFVVTERSRLGLSTSFRVQSTLTSEQTTTGVSDVNGQQYQLTLSSGWSYLLTPRASADVSVNFEEVFYQNVGDSELSDYRSGEISLTGRYSMSERSELQALVGYARYSTADKTSETDAINAQLGTTYQFSETLSFNLLVGLRVSESKEQDGTGGTMSEQGTGPTFSLNLNKELARGGRLSATATRTLAPSGGAEVLDQTELDLTVSYPVDERWTWDLGARGYRNRSSVDEGQRSGVDYAEGSLNVSYRIWPNWTVRVGYRHRWQDDEQEPDSAQSNSVFLALAWQGG